jgi:hypothetical protein
MAGDKTGLYAVGLNSGVWKTEIDREGNFNAWRQLPQSPRFAHSIAVNPGSPDHIAVGEREGDAIFPAQNNCGLWESFDGGKTFDPANHYNPLDHPCRQDNITQVVNGVVITNKSTVLISTPCGVGRKELFATTFTFAHFTLSPDDQTFSSIAIFKDWIVARTRTSIFLSNDDGKNWDEFIIQLNFPGQNFTQGNTEGIYSVCIFEEPQTKEVFIYLPVTRSPNGPCIGSDDGTNPCTGKTPDPPTCNYSSFIVFNNKLKYWSYQIIRERGLGIGLGGRVFMKSFFSSNVLLKNEVGGNSNLIFCSSQNIFKATRIQLDGTAAWENIANAKICGESKPSNFHSDIWDFLLDPSGWYSYVSNDGGVYYYAMDKRQDEIELDPDNKYLNLNEGLHTQHIHAAFIAGFLGKPPGQERYGYGSQDNGNWKTANTNGIQDWQIGKLGDVNMTEGDEANREFILTATNLQSAELLPFISTPPGAKTGKIVISYNGNNFQFIQTLKSESTPRMLDAVMLTMLPLQYKEDDEFKNVDGPLGTGTGIAIIRNNSFATNPDIDDSEGAGWAIEFNDLPNGAQSFWVAGGHADPTYFVICNQANITLLFKRKKSESKWSPIIMPTDVQILTYLPGFVQHGPLFVNPYNASEIYVSCFDGVYHGLFNTGSWTINRDDVLTNFLTDNARFDIAGIFPGGNGRNVVWSNQSSLNSMYALSWLSFNRFNTQQVVASSPFTGVFFKEGKNDWKDLSRVLPKPFTPVSSVHINNQGIYVTTEGRGMFKITNY